MANFVTKSSLQTKKIGADIIKRILKRPASKQATVVELVGDLGSGKTTLTQGAGLALGIKKGICSPTFVIYRKYLLKQKNFSHFYHFDCYRLDKNSSEDSLGLIDIIKKPQNIIFVEWPENIKSWLPKKTIKAHFLHQSLKVRKIKVVGLS